jgi:hypothetical protein
MKQSSGIEGEAVEAMACSGGEVIEGVGNIEDLKRASGKNLLSVERAAHAPDIYIGGQMHDTRSLRRVTLLFPMGNT